MRIGAVRMTEGDRRDVDVRFDRWLPDSDTITDATAEAEGIEIESVQLFGQTVKVWLSGGEVSKSYEVRVVVTTDQGRIKETCFQVRVTGC